VIDSLNVTAKIKAGMEPVAPAQQHSAMTGCAIDYQPENPVIAPASKVFWRLHSGFYFVMPLINPAR
jgi:hypothetical protein